MKQLYLSIPLLCGMIMLPWLVQGQTPSDGIMMQKNQYCVVMLYEKSSFDQYWEGTLLRENATIETVHRHMVNGGLAIGFADWFNLLVNLPYVSTYSIQPNGGHFAGASGIQDLSIYLKAAIKDFEMESGTISILGTVGFSTPASDYLSDYRPYSLGFGANELSLRTILEYNNNKNWYLRGSLAYLFRGETKAERDYYYNNGSYYSFWMDVPNAWNYQAVAGAWLFDGSLQLEAQYTGIKSVSGDDIRPYNAAQPTNRVNNNTIGLFAHYHFPKPVGLGVVAYTSQTIAGRNSGKSFQIGGGLTYYFNL